MDNKETYHIEVEPFVSFNCTSKGVQVESNGTKVEVLSICGAATSAVIEAFFRMMDNYNVPASVGMGTLLRGLEETLNKCGANIKIVQKDEE